MSLTACELKQYKAPGELFKDQVILVTGAGAGIGKAVALECARKGATVILLGKTISKLEATYDAIIAEDGPEPIIFPIDFRGANWPDYEKMVDAIKSELGRLDGLVLNAADPIGLTPFNQITPQRYQESMTINLHAPYLMVQACLPLLRASNNASIVFSTHNAKRAYWGAFGIAKAGLDGLLDILAHELDVEKNPVRVNGIDTGPVDTMMRRAIYPGENWTQWPKPEAVAPAYLYFLGADGAGKTGLNINLAAD